MASGRLVIPNFMPAVDFNGIPISGAKIYFFVNRTTTLATIYADEALTTPLANPVISDFSGQFVPVWQDITLFFSASVEGDEGVLLTVDDLEPSSNIGGAANKLDRDGGNPEPDFLANVGAADAVLSNLTDLPDARLNLGLGGAAVLGVGTGSGTVAAGDDTRVVKSAAKATIVIDNPTDATSTIQAALNDTTYNEVVIVGNGRVYDVGGLTITRPVILRGSGRPVLRVKAGYATATLLLSVGNTSDVLVDGIVFDGNTGPVTSFGNVVVSYNNNRVTFNDCDFRNCRGVALLASLGSKTIAQSCRFKNIGLYHLTSGNLADRRQAFATTQCSEPSALDCRFENVGLDCVSFATNSNLAVVRNCQINTNYAGAIYISSCVGFVCDGNIVISAGGNAIDVVNASEGSITANICKLAGGAGIMISTSNHIAVASNECKNNWKSGTSLHRGGITLSTLAGSVCEDITLTGNKCYDDQVTKTQRYAIGIYRADSAGAFNRIRIDSSNILEGYTSGGVPDTSGIFQSMLLGLTGYRFSVNVAAGEEIRLTDNGAYKTFTVFCTGPNAFGQFMVRPGASTPLELLDPASHYVVTDTGSTTAIYNDGAGSIRLRNREAVTRSYILEGGI